ncbi:hypothetical protein [Rubrivirga sp. IMCC43871]|uniref:hypothetical protein n=1 Tax=Rubrivirga sp. IMCC43871 TaxID=3391575 RepID=UPI00398FB328
MTRSVLAALVLVLATPTLAQPHDGHLFDQGRPMTNRSPRADATLDAMKPLLGLWDVAVTTYPTDSTTHQARGEAEITFMNRGYAYAERRTVPDYDPAGVDLHVHSFLVYSPSVGDWALGEGSSYTEHVEIWNGAMEGDGLALHTAVRRLGGTRLVEERVTYSMDGADAFTVLLERTQDGERWGPVEERAYTRHARLPTLVATRAGHGVPAPGLPEEARQFDFLLGTWAAAHRINLGGTWVQFPTTTTGVVALGGHGILEHSWFDLDPNLPDAATTILRLYNRAERRWESLYLTNRGNTLLDFGGAWEGDRMVLHQFDARLTDTLSRFVFHSIEPDRYQWFAESSTDRGATFATTWTIDVTRAAE